MAKRILVISTGGTIASIPTPEGLKPALTPEQLLAYLPSQKDLTLDIHALMSKDSSNIQPEDWQEMAKTIDKYINSYDGFVLTHGTDTMAYTSSALSFMLRGIEKPVILTGAQKPIQEEGTDAVRNLASALTAAQEEGLHGVYVVFDSKLINGCRASKVKAKSFDAFESINAPPCGYFVGGDKLILSHQHQPEKVSYTLDTMLDTNVCAIKLTPGFKAGTLEALKSIGYNGFVIEAYGLGGVPFERRDISADIEKIAQQGIPVAITTQCPYEGVDLTQYEVGVRALKAGAIPAHDMSKEAALTKLMWVLGHTRNLAEIKTAMLKNYCGEITL